VITYGIDTENEMSRASGDGNNHYHFRRRWRGSNVFIRRVP
jgi:hypothetical protein